MKYDPEDSEAGEDVTDLFERPSRARWVVVSIPLDRETGRALMALARPRGDSLIGTAQRLLTEAIEREVREAAKIGG